MGRPRQPLPFAFAVLGAGLALALASGCGSSDRTAPNVTGETNAPAAPLGAQARGCAGTATNLDHLHVTGINCAVGRRIAAAWKGKAACAAAPSRSRSACAVAGYRCQVVTVEPGLAVDCARPHSSISFLARRG